MTVVDVMTVAVATNTATDTATSTATSTSTEAVTATGTGTAARPVALTDADLQWLRELMELPSVSPFEGGDLAVTVAAQECLRDGARHRGYNPLRWDHPPLEFLDRPGVPQQVRRAATALPQFLPRQPSVVMSLGGAQPPARRLVLNFHMDTVGPHVPPRLDGRTLYGRGAVDDKGPGVAAVVGAAAAFAERPRLAEQIEVRIASVPGEEGGAMGVYGTRWLVETGCVGRLMVFAEPTGCRVLDACSAAMTSLLSVHGEDSTDDYPQNGHNATLALGALAVRLVERLGPLAESLGAKLCLAGLHTGELHNRVYGTGELRCNIAYFDSHAAQVLAEAVPEVVAATGAELATRFAGNPVAARLASDWSRVVRLTWLKRGLPTLANRDPELEAVLAAAGLPRHDGIADGSAFTCDAIWAGGPGRYVAVCGPGRLDRNGAHTPNEHVDLDDLDRYATHIRDLVLRFADWVS
jgi:acetylornithine deacetylase/succinyl-diaminopimelate desuccinylase-like protein